MPEFPLTPKPSHISAPEVLDPMFSMRSDQGYEVRRPQHKRPRFRYTVEWLGKRTNDMRLIRDFLMQQRLGTLPFSWRHSTAADRGVQVTNTSPILLVYTGLHGLWTGMSVVITSPVGPSSSLAAAWQITRLSSAGLQLNGSTAMGAGTCDAQVYFPKAVARFNEGTWPSAVKLLGPEAYPDGYFNWTLVIEELF